MSDLEAIFALMDEADSALDKETYDDWRRGEFDLPDDAELVITVKTDRKVNKVFEALHKLRRELEQPKPEIINCARSFDNERGNTIEMRVGTEAGAVTIKITGPTSTVENTLTRYEAQNLREMLAAVLPETATLEALRQSVRQP